MGKFKRIRKEIYIQVKLSELDVAAREFIKHFRIPFEERDPNSLDYPMPSYVKYLLEEPPGESRLR